MRYMNRYIMLVLILVSLGACRTERSPEFQLATFQCDVTPPLGTPIYSGYQPLAVVEHPLLAKGIVLNQDGQRYILCALDWCELCNSTYALFRESLAQAAGIPVDCVAIQTVHQHTAPMGDADAMRLLDNLDTPPPHPDPEVIEKAAAKVADAVRLSLEGMQKFDRVGFGQARVSEVAATRRVKDSNGAILTRWSSCKDPELRARPEGRIDPILKTITFAQGEKPLVRLHYYTTHPQSFYGDPRASYDFPGIARQKLEQEEGVFQVYFTGCAGDVTAGKYNDGTPEARTRLAAQLLAGMKAAIASTTYEPARALAWKTTEVVLPLRNDPGFTEADARKRMENLELPHSARLDGAMSLATMERGDQPYGLTMLRVNDARILHLPGECMVEYQLFSQQLHPNEFTAVAAYGDCRPGYVCTAEAYTEGGYEPTATRLAPETEGILKQAIRELTGSVTTGGN